MMRARTSMPRVLHSPAPSTSIARVRVTQDWQAATADIDTGSIIAPRMIGSNAPADIAIPISFTVTMLQTPSAAAALVSPSPIAVPNRRATYQAIRSPAGFVFEGRRCAGFVYEGRRCAALNPALAAFAA